MLKTVKDMYKYSSENTTQLLSDYSADFWSDYITNYQLYDKLFCRLYRSWFYFLQEYDQTIGEITTDFTEDVYAHLMLNEKKYSELYRIHVIDDDTYSLLDNYDMHEVMDKDTTTSGTDTFGQRIDSDSIGAQENTLTNKVAPFDSADFNNERQAVESNGTRADSHTKGSQEDSHSGSGTEDYELHRYGNIGVATATDMMDKARKFWTVWEFYEMIFKDIARELLMIGG